MNIYAQKGDKVVYLGENGYDYQREAIEKAGIKAGDTLTVERTEVYDYSTDVYLKEVGGWHNSVMFEDAE